MRRAAVSDSLVTARVAFNDYRLSAVLGILPNRTYCARTTNYFFFFAAFFFVFFAAAFFATFFLLAFFFAAMFNPL
jgi:hypothetical protein